MPRPAVGGGGWGPRDASSTRSWSTRDHGVPSAERSGRPPGVASSGRLRDGGTPTGRGHAPTTTDRPAPVYGRRRPVPQMDAARPQAAPRRAVRPDSSPTSSSKGVSGPLPTPERVSAAGGVKGACRVAARWPCGPTPDPTVDPDGRHLSGADGGRAAAVASVVASTDRCALEDLVHAGRRGSRCGGRARSASAGGVRAW
jgi:hypothetical protein